MARTITQRFGFQDPDLTTPKHDAIMIWLTDHAEEVLTAVLSPSAHLQMDGWNKSYTIEPYPGFAIHNLRTKWEFPLRSDNGYIVGFIDMLVKFEIPRLERAMYVKDFELVWKFKEQTAYFEVKSSIPSAGEVIRQINMYRVHKDDGLYIIVSPDNRFESVLKSQDIYFFQCPAL